MMKPREIDDVKNSVSTQYFKLIGALASVVIEEGPLDVVVCGCFARDRTVLQYASYRRRKERIDEGSVSVNLGCSTDMAMWLA